VNGWLHRTFLLLHNWLRRTPRRLAGRLPSPSSPQGGVSVGFAELAKKGSVAFGELSAGRRIGWRGDLPIRR